MDTTAPDFYGVLGVEPRATPAQIRAAHRRLIKRLHPDLGGSVEQFLLVERAYRTLADPQSRLAYDVDRGLSGDAGTAPAAGTAAPPRAAGSAPPPGAGAHRPAGARGGVVTEAVVRLLRGARRVRAVLGQLGGLTARYERAMARAGVITRGRRAHPVTWTLVAGLYGACWYVLHASGLARQAVGAPGLLPQRFWGTGPLPAFAVLFAAMGMAVAWQTWIPPLRRMHPRRRQRLWVRGAIGLLYGVLTWGLFLPSRRAAALAGLTAALVVVVSTPWMWLPSRALRALLARITALPGGVRRRLAEWWAEVQARV